MNSRRTMMVWSWTMLMGMAGTPAVTAQEARPVPTIVQSIEKCRSISNGEARLACFDAAAAGLADAIGSKQVVVVEQKEITKTKRSLFGFRLPELGIFGEDGSPENQQLLTTVRQAVLGKNGRWNITTAESAIWQTTENLKFQPKPGDELEIKSGALGSFFLKLRGKRAVRAIRIQ